MEYIEERPDSCPFCAEIFQPGDDIVEQPGTGVLYHRDCYNREIAKPKTA